MNEYEKQFAHETHDQRAERLNRDREVREIRWRAVSQGTGYTTHVGASTEPTTTTYTGSPIAAVDFRKQHSVIIGDFELTIKHPAHVVIPQDIDRLLKSIAKKVEDWARESAR